MHMGRIASDVVLGVGPIPVCTILVHLVVSSDKKKFFKSAGAGSELEEGLLLASGGHRLATRVAAGAETAMELDSSGRMREFDRESASKDRSLDNARAILIGISIQRYLAPVFGTIRGMVDVFFSDLHDEWGLVRFFLLMLARGGGLGRPT